MSGQIYKFDNFELDVANRQLRRDEKPIQLPAKAFDLLQTLIENNNRLVSKDELFSRVWQDQIVEESNLTVHISQIRKALGETKNNPRFLTTVPGYGYRFSCDVQSLDAEDLVIEKHTLARITIEREEESETGRSREGKKESALRNLPSPFLHFLPSLKIIVGASVLAICLALGFGVYKILFNAKTNEPFEKIKFARLTNNGKVAAVAMSSDAKFIAYVLGEPEGNSIWIRQVGTGSDIRVVAPTRAQIWELKFTPDGRHIYYNLFSEKNTTPELFRIPVLGGVSEPVLNVIASFIAFSPDGRRMAYVQPDSAAGYNYLVVADTSGGNQQIISKKKHPDTFESQASVVSWSPDGETIACLVNKFEPEASYSAIVGINARNGGEKLLSAQRWYNVHSIEWLKNGSGLLFNGSDKISGGKQIRFLSYPQGEARQITDDLSQYDRLSTAGSGESFAVVQTNTVSGIFVGEAGAEAKDFHEIVSETAALHPIVWTPEGKIIFRSVKDGVSNLWTMDADGGNHRQLTADAQVDSRGMCVSPDSKYVVFGSWRTGKSNLWRVDANGENLTQLTDSEGDFYPACSPDGRWVVYQKGLHSTQTLWKAPIEGGEPVRLTDFRGKWAAISSDGGQVSYFHMADDKWRIGVVSSEGGAMLRRVNVPTDLAESKVQWSPDGRALFYISTTGSVGNIRSLPLDTSEGKSVTNFKSHQIDDFAFSPDMKRVAVTRSLSVRDVVLLTNEAVR